METIKLISLSFSEGVYDSLRNIFVIFYLDKEMNKKLDAKAQKLTNTQLTTSESKKSNKEKKKEKKSNVSTRVFQCCILNGGIFLLSLLFFDYMLLPALKTIITYFLGHSQVWDFIQMTLSWIFSFIWIVPLFVLSKIINTFWFQDIADAAYEFRKGRPTLIPSLSKLLADVVFSLIVQSLFLFQSMSMSFVPYMGKLLSFLHICLLYSLYSFEYKWFNQGYELHKRLLLIESNWPYFLGFGFILALLTQACDSFVINGCLFSMFFPLFIISSSESSPQQRINYPLRCFSLVVLVSNCLVSRKLKTTATSRR
ncbi:CLUMA_CG009082, isoform A [Clunio marinus]|uniref:CLUMA_CG009082, isoform A n=1 Tax=Clunio marinus TaxID=568069 RepID=A0A1J1I5S5_9DIPT|nr:CLUMA_CG009082, isoform A [Clunio marinus]